jgi:putative Holliday junction resolvase
VPHAATSIVSSFPEIFFLQTPDGQADERRRLLSPLCTGYRICFSHHATHHHPSILVNGSCRLLLKSRKSNSADIDSSTMKISEVKERGKLFLRLALLLLLSLSLCDGFLLFDSSFRTSIPLYSVEDAIKAAASGQALSGDAIMSIMSAAAAATQESCQMLGIKSVGVDYGLVRTGVAATIGYDPKPLIILSDMNSTEVSQAVIKICRAEQASQVIVGLPLHKNGTEANQTTITRVFAAELADHVIKNLGPKVPVYLFDERYTSKEAAARAHSKDRNRDLRGQLDADAACIILESYYSDNGHGAELVEVHPQLYEEYVQIWEEKKIEEGERLNAAQKDRDARLSWRKQAMERDRQLELELSQSTPSKKKKKKKGK